MKTVRGPSFRWVEPDAGPPIVFTATYDPPGSVSDFLLQRGPFARREPWVAGGGNAHQRRIRRRAWARAFAP